MGFLYRRISASFLFALQSAAKIATRLAAAAYAITIHLAECTVLAGRRIALLIIGCSEGIIRTFGIHHPIATVGFFTIGPTRSRGSVVISPTIIARFAKHTLHDAIATVFDLALCITSIECIGIAIITFLAALQEAIATHLVLAAIIAGIAVILDAPWMRGNTFSTAALRIALACSICPLACKSDRGTCLVTSSQSFACNSRRLRAIAQPSIIAFFP
ncbi:hypothetical protein A2765_01245 [Candidatus Kaiserbacteria bacterium RIFCSPHIGHO2_01_FULL_56_24]|uniref:Uncharacterized protein n=1 Tax=Candidatus Kaiserbacteria bacterium RIFCSPHIGHO2_01_FULL_56_24 TaxID=1798487 RepID=A0A1F6DHF2_9BACT|nr:MAG: hypothetical protein A2765_01245 [Candidatus Kaiserbacteria bacterium RIFCSPHIGHO2_01_FULL_56_24]